MAAEDYLTSFFLESPKLTKYTIQFNVVKKILLEVVQDVSKENALNRWRMREYMGYTCYEEKK